MIALSRAMVRQFRLVARRGLSTGRPRGLPVRITAADNSVTLAAHLGDVVVAWTQPAPQAGGAGSLILPMSELEKFEGTGSEVVVLEAGAGQRGQARWRIGDSPCTTELELVETSLVWPAVPEELFTLPPTFLQALHEAGRTAAREQGKYAFDGIQVRGKAGQLIATDGKQALIQGGFQFPFAEDLIVPAVPLFGAKELTTEETVNIDRIDDWLFVETGAWHIWLKSDPEKRFPDVVDAIPRATGTHFGVHDEDAQKVLDVLPQLPKIVGEDIPVVTLELGRSVVMRAQSGAKGEIVEVPLRRSECHGPDMQIVLNRAHLGRALALGFREFRCASSKRPMVAMDGPRMYLTATLSPSLAAPAAKSAAGEASPSRSLSPSRPPVDSTRFSRSTPMPARESPSPERNGHAEANGETIGDPLLEAEALRTTLGEAQAQTGRLIAALKGFRKQHKSVSSALASLRSLRLE